MTSEQAVVYYCDDPDCTEVHIGRPGSWWLGRGTHFCPLHRPVCKRCGVRLRNQRREPENAPGTVRVGTRGNCESCSQTLRRAKAVPNIDTVDGQQVRSLRRLITDRYDDPDDRLLALQTLGLIGEDLD